MPDVFIEHIQERGYDLPPVQDIQVPKQLIPVIETENISIHATVDVSMFDILRLVIRNILINKALEVKSMNTNQTTNIASLITAILTFCQSMGWLSFIPESAFGTIAGIIATIALAIIGKKWTTNNAQG